MGMLYRRKKVDPATGKKVERGPWWIKYYRDGRPFFESTETEDKREARKTLKGKEGDVAEGRHQGTRVNKTRFNDLVEVIKLHYKINRKKSERRLNDFIKHLSAHFGNMKASKIGTGVLSSR